MYLKFSNEEILDYLQQLYQSLNKTPSRADIVKEGYITTTTIAKRFGSYNNALIQAGIKDIRKQTTVQESRAQLLELYNNFCEDIGKTATSVDLDKSDKIYNSDVFISRFGSMTDLYKAVHRIPNRSRLYRQPTYTKEALQRELMILFHKKGTSLTQAEINAAPSLPSLSTILRCFSVTGIQELWKILNPPKK